MNLKDVCRACLHNCRTMCSPMQSIVPKFDSLPTSVKDIWNIYTKILITCDESFPDKICNDCLIEIHRTYSFILKCETSENILKEMKTVQTRSDEGSRYIKSENDVFPNISQIKTERIDWNDGAKVDEEKTRGSEQCDEDSRIELKDQVDCEEVLVLVDIKQEPAHNMKTEKYEEIDLLDKSSNEIFKCPACNYECIIMKSLEKHIIEYHMQGEICKLCNKEFKCTATEHCAVHLNVNKTEGVIKCTKVEDRQCKMNSNIYGFKRYTGERPFKCVNCAKSFRQNHHLTDHLRCHTGERPFKCEICMKTFGQKSILTRHLRSHSGERPFKCNICPKTFGQKSILTKHKICHRTERPFKCEICLKAFRQQSILTKHLSCHGEERPFQCEICLKTYRQKNNLRDHLRCHTGERPFKCEICPKTFGQKNHLMDHLRCHTGERPFKCDICLKTFGQKGILTRHLISHTTDSPFKCEICAKTFRQKTNLTRHLKSHVEEKLL